MGHWVGHEDGHASLLVRPSPMLQGSRTGFWQRFFAGCLSRTLQHIRRQIMYLQRISLEQAGLIFSLCAVRKQTSQR